MRRSLIPHPQSRSTAVRSIEVVVDRPFPHVLMLRYIVSGDIAGLAMTAPGDPVRADELWRHTCFEAFAREAGLEPYYEFNFAPSRAWAAYWFEGERRGMRVASEMEDLAIDVSRQDQTLEIGVELSLHRLISLPARSVWRLALSAVIEETDGTMSYWSLVHPTAKPDFHHSDCFALELPSALRS
jgi:hypothetical protein